MGPAQGGGGLNRRRFSTILYDGPGGKKLPGNSELFELADGASEHLLRHSFDLKATEHRLPRAYFQVTSIAKKWSKTLRGGLFLSSLSGLRM